MSDLRYTETATRPGLALLLGALQPRSEAPPAPEPPAPDPEAIRAAAHEAGYEAGFAAGEASAMASLAPLRQRLAEAASALHAACRIDPAALRPLLADLVRRTAEAVLAAELKAGATALLPLVDTALAAVRPGAAVTLVAHPVTLAALAPQLPVLATVGDAEMAEDSFAVTGADFVVAVDLAARLDDALAGLA